MVRAVQYVRVFDANGQYSKYSFEYLTSDARYTIDPSHSKAPSFLRVTNMPEYICEHEKIANNAHAADVFEWRSSDILESFPAFAQHFCGDSAAA
jgi:hypothetical protein